jgi:hypothetical protein
LTAVELQVSAGLQGQSENGHRPNRELVVKKIEIAQNGQKEKVYLNFFKTPERFRPAPSMPSSLAQAAQETPCHASSAITESAIGSSLVGVTQIVEVALKCKEQVGLEMTIP